jgi:hypothetical protein
MHPGILRLASMAFNLVYSCAVLYLVLLSGETLKWAKLTDLQEKGFGVLQLALSSGMAFLCLVLILMRSKAFAKLTKVSNTF